MFDWHFTLRGTRDTEFEGGIYHGRILLPADYPFKPPNIILLTPNGRFEVRKKICLSISAHHPEEWQPAWGVRLILEALISFMPTQGEGAIGALNFTVEERRRLAIKSREFCCDVCGNIAQLLPELSEGSITNEKKESEYAEQIAKLHVHTVEKEAEKQTTAENARSESSVPQEESSSPHDNQNNTTLYDAQVTTPPQSATSHPNGDFVSDVLGYLAVAIAIALFALIYKRLLQVYGIL
ncbi:hypothetical protein ABG067_000870 [Albugo candida]